MRLIPRVASLRRWCSTAALPRPPKVVFVTGGADGIGRAICDSFLTDGATVYAFDIDGEMLRCAAAEVADWNRTPLLRTIQGDASCAADVNAAVARIVAESDGAIDVVVNNCAIQPPESCVPIHTLSEEHWDRLLAVNLTSIYRTSRAALPHMLANGRGGSIINIASVQGLQSMPSVPAYAASKGAALSLTRQMALDYGASNIRVNAISPGTIRTALVERLDAAGTGPSIAEQGGNYPLQNRIGEPREVGDVAVFLASEKASFITGENIVVDGGIMAQGGWA